MNSPTHRRGGNSQFLNWKQYHLSLMKQKQSFPPQSQLEQPQGPVVTVNSTSDKPYRWQNVVLLIVALLINLTTSGTVLGWPNIVVVLTELGVYSDLCKGTDCSQQTLRLSLIFIVGLSANQVAGKGQLIHSVTLKSNQIRATCQ
jgi:hypothetical protein